MIPSIYMENIRSMKKKYKVVIQNIPSFIILQIVFEKKNSQEHLQQVLFFGSKKPFFVFT